MYEYIKNNWKPIVSAIVIFFSISVVYFTPVIQGKVLEQHDMMVWKGASKEAADFKKETGENTLWTNSMFSGMPTYLINNLSDGNQLKLIHRTINFFGALKPLSFLFLYLLGFFIALLAFGVNPWLSIVGALAFAFSSYFFIIIQAGHLTKAYAIGYMAPIIAGIYLAFNKKQLWGTILMAFFLSFQLLVNHLQITYYTFLIILVFGVSQVVNSIKEKQMRAFLKSMSYLTVGALLAIGTNFLSLSTVYDYGKDSIRGPSELTSEMHNKTSGLDKDYATGWSYGIFESLNVMVPNLMGGASQSDLGTKSETYKALKTMGQPNAKQIVKKMPTYWGDQPFTSGPTYIGALVVFLFVLGLFVVKGQLKWWLLTATVLSFMLAWGKNMMWFTDLFLDYFPGYNKFRAVSMTLVMAELTIPLLGILGLQRIISGDFDSQKIKKQLLYALSITGGVILLLILALPSSSSAFVSASDTSIFGQNQVLLDAIRADRASLFRVDALRSLFFIIVGALAVWLFITKKIKQPVLLLVLALAIIIDLWTVDKRYLNNDSFVRESQTKNQFQPSVADKSILQDKSESYRVLNISVSTFNDATTSYFHKSIGGYHGAKMRRYQELISHYLAPEVQLFGAALQNSATQASVQQALSNMQMVNMLNGKYIIYNPKAPAIPNSFANGNAWFVSDYRIVDNADEEIAALSGIDTKRTAIIDKRFKDRITDFTKDESAKIDLVSYAPNYLVYQSEAKSNQMAVFSEIYYDKGWIAYIDGKEVPYYRANYVLRAMNIPAGKHKIEFKFEPAIYSTGIVVGIISSILLLLLFASGFVYDKIKANKKLE